MIRWNPDDEDIKLSINWQELGVHKPLKNAEYHFAACNTNSNVRLELRATKQALSSREAKYLVEVERLLIALNVLRYMQMMMHSA